MMDINKIYCENCLDTMSRMPDNFIDCCVTSPPYYGLRDYGTAKWVGGIEDCQHTGARVNPINVGGFTGERLRKINGSENEKYLKYKNTCPDCSAVRIDEQIGLEETPELYVQKLVHVFAEVKRVLKKEGTLWLNLGDSYYNISPGNGGFGKKQKTNKGSHYDNSRKIKYEGIKPKDLVGIPWMVAFDLRADGWYLRQDIIWHKPNPMPESVTDRCTKAHEYIFLLSKSSKYYYDADSIKQTVVDATVLRMAQQIEKQKGSERVPGKTNGNIKAVGPGRNPRKGGDTNGGNQASDNGIPAMALNGNGVTGHSGYFDSCGNLIGNGMANKKSVWTICTMPFKEAHFATFPEDLIIPCIKAGSPEGGIVYDPFSGAGTTVLVSHKLKRQFIGSEISQEYCDIAQKRIQPYLDQKTLF